MRVNVFVYCVLLAIVSSCSNNATKEHDYFVDYLRGDVKAMDITIYKASLKFGEPKEDYEDGTISCQFSKSHQLEKLMVWDDMDKTEMDNCLKCKYDNSGNLELVDGYYSNGTLDYEIKFIRKENKLDRMDQYRYYSDGSHKKVSSIFISYGEKQVYLKFVDIDKASYHVEAQITFNLDDIGRIESGTLVDSGEKYEGRIIRNEENLPIESMNCLFMYLEGSYLFPSLSLNFENGKFLYEYEMDSHKNWVKKVVYKNDKNTVMHIVKRTIEYYD